MINLNNYPRASATLQSELLDRVGADLRLFHKQVLYNQVKSIHQLFGYPYDIDIGLSEDELLDKAYNILYLYEDARNQTIFPVTNITQDPIVFYTPEDINTMFMENRSVILPSLSSTLRDREQVKDYSIKDFKFLSLRDTLVDMLEHIKPSRITDNEDFWNESIQWSWDCKANKTEIPF